MLGLKQRGREAAAAAANVCLFSHYPAVRSLNRGEGRRLLLQMWACFRTILQSVPWALTYVKQ
jgi:hypothetical protein